MSRNSLARGDIEAHEAARVVGLAAAAIVNFGRGLSPAEILQQAKIYENFIVDGPTSTPAPVDRPKKL